MKKQLLTALAAGTFLLCGLGTASAIPTLVGSAALVNDGVQHEYKLYSYNSGDSKDWDNAVTQAPSGFHLSTITTKEENDFINSSFFMNTGDHLAFSGEVWIGGFQNSNESDPKAKWAWVTGETWSYTNWSPNEPNDYYYPGSEKYLGANWLGQWNDEAALGNVKGFVVENTVPVPEPTTMLLFGTGIAGLAAFGRRIRS